MPIMVDQSISLIRAWLARPSSTKERLAETAKVHRNTLLGVSSEDWNPRADTLRKLESAVKRLQKAKS